jgi:hypothetical protein
MEHRRNDSSERDVGSRSISGRDRESADAAERADGWMQPGDETLMGSLCRDGPKSCPLLAARIGMYLNYAGGRCEGLKRAGSFGRVTGGATN